jgi:hypothetical protein
MSIDNTQPQSAGPDSTPDQQPSLFQRLMADQIAPSADGTQNQQPVQNPPQPDPAQVKDNREKALDFHPAVTAAHVMRKVGEAISGGPQYKEAFDPNTGAVTRTPIPPSTKSILLGSLANILGSVGQVSSNVRQNGRTGSAAYLAATDPSCTATAWQSEEDFNTQQNQRVRMAKIMNANLEAMRTAYAIGKEDDAVKDQLIANHASELDNWNKAGAVEASNIPSSELLKKGLTNRNT